ncbi:uncharacterized protein LOC112576618 [Pomacea canaliculata]|uniref:uncharacterized protein LOC112576618 n=1 Tax=Pomacea canaliculata TaxID=400727 RepID=UPI000D73D148|nr:uncharacterized protein LOC112576618 [Pomacea canaliculata]XP_025115007.1 uncharacterized protein LOC112576618 [Pomacea canaliculata]
MTTSTLSSLLVGLLAVVVAVVMASVIPVEKNAEREARAADCHVDGRFIPDGHNFTRFTTGPCVVFKCNAGVILPLKSGCYRNGQCYPVGDKYTLGCLERTCNTTNGIADYELTKEGCLAYDGLTCVNVGTTWTSECITYHCSRIVHSEFSISYHMEPVAWGCHLGEVCVPENHTITEDCRVEQCQRHFSSIGFYTLKLGCPLSGECLEIGQSKTIDCTTLTCQREDFEGIHYLSIRPTKIQCQDADKRCHDSGSYFPVETNGRRLNCTCFVHEGFLGSTYSCPLQ